MIGIVGETVQLPCNFSLNKMREIELILWYKGQGGKPIFTLDTRTTPLLKHLTSSTRRTDLYKSKLASASLLSKLQQSPIITTGTKRAENRFTFNLTGELAYLQIKQVAATDQSGYKCRVDYKQSRSDYHQVNLTVIGECVENNLWSTQVIRLPTSCPTSRPRLASISKNPHSTARQMTY